MKDKKEEINYVENIMDGYISMGVNTSNTDAYGNVSNGVIYSRIVLKT